LLFDAIFKLSAFSYKIFWRRNGGKVCEILVSFVAIPFHHMNTPTILASLLSVGNVMSAKGKKLQRNQNSASV